MNSGSSSNTGALRMKTLLISQMYEGKLGGVEVSNSKHTNSTGPENSNSNAALHSVFESILRESNSEYMNSAHPQVVSWNLNFNGQLPSINESILDEILDKGLPYMVESILNEMLDEQAGASGSQKVISRNSNFDASLPSMIKSIIKEVLDEGDPELIRHDPDLKDALTSVIKSRIDNWAQGEVKEPDSEQIDTTDQEINRGSSSNTGAVQMKTLLISQMYEGRYGGVEESASMHRNNPGPEVISYNSGSNAGLHSVFESILRESSSEHLNTAHPQLNSSSSNFGVIWGKIIFIIEMLQRRKSDTEEANFEPIDSMDLELPQPQLQSQEERPAEVHRQQHFRFPVVKYIAER